MNQIQKATPYKVEQQTPIRKFEIEETGRVKMTETTTTEVYFEAREFITFKRSFDESKMQLKEQLSKETQEKIKKEITKIDKQLELINPLIEIVEAKAKLHYEKLQKESAVDSLKEIAKNPKDKERLIAEIWKNMDSVQRAKLSIDEQKVVLKAIAKLKRS